MRVRIGTAGWSIPRALAAEFGGDGSHLERYGRRLNCAEINSSFYRMPRVGTWGKWAASVPQGFQFSLKAPKAITHEKKLAGVREELAGFFAGISELGERLGPVLFQLPPKLAFEERLAAEFFELVRGMYAGLVVLEPRHASWFTDEVAEVLCGFSVARVAADPARVAEGALPGGWDGVRYWRLHGSPRIYYSAYGEGWLRGLQELVRDEDWVVFDNTASGAAAADALLLMELLAQR